MSAFGGKADMTYCDANVRFMTQIGHSDDAFPTVKERKPRSARRLIFNVIR